jgi:hypothetical protein
VVIMDTMELGASMEADIMEPETMAVISEAL